VDAPILDVSSGSIIVAGMANLVKENALNSYSKSISF
jgi:hypothetical protein